MAEEEQGGGGGGGFKKILILLVLLAAAGAAAYFLLMNDEDAKEEQPEIIREGPPPIENPQYTDLGTFVVNLRDGKYYLKTSLQLVFADLAPKMWMDKRMPLVKDLVISQFQAQTAKQLEDPKTRRLLRNELLIKINSLFPNNPPWKDNRPVKKILFTEFYTQ